MRNEITMRQYGLSEKVEKSAECFADLTVSRVLLQEKVNNDFNIRRLERYVSIAWNSGAVPVVVLTKSDLCEDLDSKLIEVSSVATGVDVLVTNTLNQNGYEQINRPDFCGY